MSFIQRSERGSCTAALLQDCRPGGKWLRGKGRDSKFYAGAIYGQTTGPFVAFVVFMSVGSCPGLGERAWTVFRCHDSAGTRSDADFHWTARKTELKFLPARGGEGVRPRCSKPLGGATCDWPFGTSPG